MLEKNEIKELRRKAGLTQREAAEALGMSLRSYQQYESEGLRPDSLKHRYIVRSLEDLSKVDESHGTLSIDEIKEKCALVFADYDVNSCYLVGSYARGNPREDSDIDLVISSNVSGLAFNGLAENLRSALSKKVDLYDTKSLISDEAYAKSLMNEGIKVFG